MVFHLRNAYLIDISLSRAFLAGVYPVDVHLIGVLLKVPIQSRNLHLDRIAPCAPTHSQQATHRTVVLFTLFIMRSLIGVYILQACNS